MSTPPSALVHVQYISSMYAMVLCVAPNLPPPCRCHGGWSAPYMWHWQSWNPDEILMELRGCVFQLVSCGHARPWRNLKFWCRPGISRLHSVTHAFCLACFVAAQGFVCSTFRVWCWRLGFPCTSVTCAAPVLVFRFRCWPCSQPTLQHMASIGVS